MRISGRFGPAAIPLRQTVGGLVEVAYVGHGADATVVAEQRRLWNGDCYGSASYDRQLEVEFGVVGHIDDGHELQVHEDAQLAAEVARGQARSQADGEISPKYR